MKNNLAKNKLIEAHTTTIPSSNMLVQYERNDVYWKKPKNLVNSGVFATFKRFVCTSSKLDDQFKILLPLSQAS